MKINVLKPITIAACCVFTSNINAAPTKASGQLPNIIYILADDMGYGDVSALNPDSKIQTPNIDRLAKDGMRFTDAHSGSSVCTPTRYGILTGRYCWRTRLKSQVLWNYDNSLMDAERLNIASFLKDQGYNTAMVGKWHLGMDWVSKSNPDEITNKEEDVDFTQPFRNGPVDMGFDMFYGINASLDMPPYIFLEQDMAVTQPTGKIGKKEYGRAGMADEKLSADDFLPAFTEKAVSYIKSQDKNTPFFLYFPLNAPHTPIAPSEAFQGKSKLEGKLGEYADFCIEVDDTVGQILNALNEKGLSENTIVIFTADNGCAYYIGVKEFEESGHYPSAIYRGYKGGTFDGGHRVPFLVQWPATIKPATENNQPISLTDLLATCADILGAELPNDAGEDSLSFLTALQGDSIDTSRRPAVVHHDFNGDFAIRQGKWKLLIKANAGLGYKEKKFTPGVHLYDLEKDPGENSNVADQHPEKVKELSDLLEKYKSEEYSVSRD
ncbi:sulfatase-like hydrolase/transferase [Pontiellaceae bacterium B1224]|nr:sulfatase-like hydrolase/transferase [Pontiellaceae bacterium B1224]